MTEPTEKPVASTDDAAERRDAVVAEVADHAGEMARELALLQGGDYGSRTFATDAGEWTLKYEAGALQYLRFDGGSAETYVVSTKHPPDPEDLATAMDDYAAFVESYNEYVASLEGVLDDVSADFPEVASTESVVAERDRILDRVRDAADRMALELSRYEGEEYGTFSTRVSGTRWELKWNRDGASYLRVGGEGGVYLLSQYEHPSARDVRKLAEDVGEFVEAFNDHVAELDADLSDVSL
ncbi:hypothetical protein NGM10_11530 [Halorussus salilacus]|uniref:hypothetical protein n=1 Tax=Halorussus salilacus TaxID=2953750 RepID=UPI0020A214E6|nr:hypothetical protein [Halorussus salilacus]USZ67361.1 hypothetical protein NGM10_11530 [Halorussus salilacus]